jgi:hypothetical protein
VDYLADIGGKNCFAEEQQCLELPKVSNSKVVGFDDDNSQKIYYKRLGYAIMTNPSEYTFFLCLIVSLFATASLIIADA